MQSTKIEWTSKVWNVSTGCLHGCDFCYARRMANRLRGRCGYPTNNPFRPIFHENKLDEPAKLKKPSKILVSSMGDLFGEWNLHEQIEKVFKVVRECPQHTFQFLTKNPRRYMEFSTILPRNAWYGTSVDHETKLWRIEYLRILPNKIVKFVSFEPLLSRMDELNLSSIHWAIIGALTGPKKFKPPEEWINCIEVEARNHGVRIFEKNNLYNDKTRKLIQEFPN